MDQITVIINSFWGMGEERRRDTKNRREGKKERQKLEGQVLKERHIWGEKIEKECGLNEQMEIRDEETERRVSVEAEGQRCLTEKRSWGWTLVSVSLPLDSPEGFWCW